MAGLNNIFMSYRRDDSAGHAGRLQDGLTERFGAGRVFMDVSDLKPGQDYVVELDRALAKADCVLVVIGPRWLNAVDASGRRRIDDASDLVCREIGAGLTRQATVIPVLVHGAAMPAAEALPPALRALARRQAITLTDQRWDRDLDELVRVLSADGAAAPPLRVAVSRAKWIGAALLLALILVAGGTWMRPHSTRGKQEPVAAKPVSPVGTSASPQLAATAAASPLRFAITIPTVSEVRFRTHRARLRFSILAIRLEPRDGATLVLSVLVRMHNNGPLDEAFNSDLFRLVAGDQVIAPTLTFHTTTEPVAARETKLDFVLPSAVMEPLLEVRVNTETTRMPMSLTTRSPIANNGSLDTFGQPRRVRVVDAIKTLPATLAAGQRVEVGKPSYQIVAATVERETVEKASLTLTVRCSVPRDANGVNFWSNTVRLWIDGVPRAPVNNVNEIVGPGDSKDARFEFDLLALPHTIEVGIVSSGDSAKIALSLDSLLMRPSLQPVIQPLGSLWRARA